MPARPQRLPDILGAWARRIVRALNQGALPIAPLPDGSRSFVAVSAQRIAGIACAQAWQQHLRLKLPPYSQWGEGFRAGQCQFGRLALHLPRWQRQRPPEEERRALLGSVLLAQREVRGETEADIPPLRVGRGGVVRGFVGSCPLPLVGAALLLRPLPSVRPLPLEHQARHGSPERALASVLDLPEERPRADVPPVFQLPRKALESDLRGSSLAPPVPVLRPNNPKQLLRYSDPPQTAEHR